VKPLTVDIRAENDGFKLTLFAASATEGVMKAIMMLALTIAI
jgi:hypothetical protein